MHGRSRRIGVIVSALLLSALVPGTAKAKIWQVAQGDNLQQTINNAQSGDTIHIAAGATFVGSFTLPAKSGSAFITIRAGGFFPSGASGTTPDRVNPSKSPKMAHLLAAGANQPVIQTAPGAHHYQLIGLEIAPSSPSVFVTTLVKLGDGSSAQNNLSQVPHDLIMDRCYIHGLSGVAMVRGIALNSAATSIVNSYISDIKSDQQDSQAICGWNGPGPFTISNNYLEAAGENVMFGGADPSIPNLVPSDIQMLGNYLTKPLSWYPKSQQYAGKHWLVKNLLEIKNAQRLTVQGNLFENTWQDAQVGYAVLFKSLNQDGTAPWSICQDVNFSNNIVRHAGAGVNILGRSDNAPCQQARRIKIANNLFDDISDANWGGDGTFLQVTDTVSVTVDHNTAFQTGNIIKTYGNISPSFVFTNNILPHNLYGVKGDGAGVGNPTLSAYFPGCTYRANAMEAVPNGNRSSYPNTNYFPANWPAVVFVDMPHGNYSLALASPYHNAGTDGCDVGDDMLGH